MIQRIQSLYLVIALGFLGSMFFLPLAEITKEASHYLFNIKGISSISETSPSLIFNGWPILVMYILTLALTATALFLFKNRTLQVRISVFSLILMLGLTGVIFFFASNGASNLEAEYSLKIAFVFPIVSAILTYLAIRGILKDEALIKSMDRIR